MSAIPPRWDGGLLILDSGTVAPWDGLAKQIWAGKDLDQIGKTKWSWRVVRK